MFFGVSQFLSIQIVISCLLITSVAAAQEGQKGKINVQSNPKTESEGATKAGTVEKAADVAKPSIALHGNVKYQAGFEHFDYANPEALKGGMLKLAVEGTSFDTFNPFTLKGIAAAGAGSVFETLMEQTADEPFSQYGLIAKSVAVPADRSYVEYEIRPEAKFSNGSQITPEDVIFSFTILKEKGQPFYRTYYKDVAKVEQTGKLKVRFVFGNKANAELPLIVGQLPVFSKEYWQGKDFAETTLKPILGSGPYVIDDFSPGRFVTYKRNTDWWGKNLAVNKGRYNFDKISYEYYRDSAVSLEAFLAGRYDIRQENSAKNWQTAYSTPAVQDGRIIKAEMHHGLSSGMQAFVFNIRRPIFQDSRVRQALNYAFDFEWSNKNVAFSAYKRTNSFFVNSELASTGLPSADELSLLEPYRAQLPDEVFSQEFTLPKTDGTGNSRDNLRKAAELLKSAGWSLKEGKLVDVKGNLFKFELIDNSPLFERWIQPFVRNLERLGITVNYRVVDTAQFQNLLDNFDFDMTIGNFYPQSLSPGNEQREYWGSAMADQKGSRNLIGIKNPVIDDLVQKLINASDRKALVTICHALDRVLLWNFYVIPNWYNDSFRLAYWNIFGKPEISPPFGLAYIDTWWIDPKKAALQPAGQK